MAISDESSSTVNDRVNTTRGSTILDHNHPLYLHPSDGPGSMSVGLILTGMENYTLWSRAMKVALLGKNKLCLVDGSTSKEDFGSDLAHQWNRCNAIVTSWLMSNVSMDLITGVLLSSNARTVWAAFKERFDKVNGSRLYYLHKEIFTMTQGICSVSTYFTKLRDLWAEYDSILPPPPAIEYVERLEYQHLLQFLMGLSDSFEQARSQILLMPTLPSINKAYAMVVQDESRRMITGNNYGNAGNIEPTALFTAQSGNKQRRHLKDKCYKIVGYPPDFKPKGKANAALLSEQPQTTQMSNQQISNATVPAQFFTQDQYNQLLQLLNKNSVGYANAHMADLLHNKQSVGSTGQVQLPTGDSATISHMGECQLTGGDTLKDVLCVPAFKFNLLSVSNMTKDLKCCVTFFPQCFVFRDLLSGKVKGIGKEEEGLYVLSTSVGGKVNRAFAATSGAGADLCHKRTGHVPMQSYCLYTHQQNGVVERRHRHILEMARAIRFQGHLPVRYWGHCIDTTFCIINRIPSSILVGKSPYEMLHGKQPSLSHLRVLGCICFATNLIKHDKFEPRAVRSVLLGYAAH
ncbi:PREDICTED: uncharacterized protein LOC109219749 [Nicotiana attenuata]|uniref:uncharacterized protein LOC109219749 n=1 Tax=Nicotiana attenuata TaxID=49451 RepID=UPI000904911F|nr:PREDICTED: uncharacterized protein LOC109219749 [Nicotiana attenuata]